MVSGGGGCTFSEPRTGHGVGRPYHMVWNSTKTLKKSGRGTRRLFLKKIAGALPLQLKVYTEA